MLQRTTMLLSEEAKYGHLVDRRFLITNPDNGAREIGRKVRFGADIGVEPYFLKSAPEKIPIVLVAAGENPDADRNLMLGAPFELDRGLRLPEYIPMRILKNSGELVGDVRAFEVLVDVRGDREGDQISMLRIRSKFFELLVEMICLLVGQDSVGLSRRSVGNDVARVFGVRLRLGLRDGHYGRRRGCEFHERRGNLAKATNTDKRSYDERTQNGDTHDPQRPVRRRLPGRLQAAMNEPGGAKEMPEGKTSEGECRSHEGDLEVFPRERIVARGNQVGYERNDERGEQLPPPGAITLLSKFKEKPPVVEVRLCV